MTLTGRLAGACAPSAVLVVRCARCNLLRVPRPGQQLALCRSCAAEVESLFRDEPTNAAEGNA